jgi:hypothetical protein
MLERPEALIPVSYGALVKEVHERKNSTVREALQIRKQKSRLPPLRINESILQNQGMSLQTETDKGHSFWVNEESKSIYQLPRKSQPTERLTTRSNCFKIV